MLLPKALDHRQRMSIREKSTRFTPLAVAKKPDTHFPYTLQKSGPLHPTDQFPQPCPVSPAPPPAEPGGIDSSMTGHQTTDSLSNPSGRRNFLASSLV